MTLDFINISKCIKLLFFVVLMQVFCVGCSSQQKSNVAIHERVESMLANDEYFTIYMNSDGTYLYEIYTKDGNVAWREILHKEPTIRVYDSRYIEVKWGVGTGVWLNVYYDLETSFITQPLECARYIDDGIIGLMQDEAERELCFLNPFSYSDYYQRVQLDFDNEMVNPSDCIIQLIKDDENTIQIEYWNRNGEQAISSVLIEQ